MSDIQQFTLNDAVRTKVREAFMSVIPAELLNQYIEKEIRGFFANEQEYNKKERPHSSPFASLVREQVRAYLAEQLSEKVKEMVTAELQKVGPQNLVELVVVAQKEYQQRFFYLVTESMFSSLPNQIENIVRQMKQDGRL